MSICATTGTFSCSYHSSPASSGMGGQIGQSYSMHRMPFSVESHLLKLHWALHNAHLGWFFGFDFNNCGTIGCKGKQEHTLQLGHWVTHRPRHFKFKGKTEGVCGVVSALNMNTSQHQYPDWVNSIDPGNPSCTMKLHSIIQMQRGRVRIATRKRVSTPESNDCSPLGSFWLRTADSRLLHNAIIPLRMHCPG